MQRLIIISSFVFALVPNAFAETMTAKQIEEELIGRTLCITAKAGVVCARHKAGGTSEIVSGLEKQKGTWKLKGNKLCVTWEKIRAGKEGCAGYDKTKNAFSSPSFGKITVK
ncbi:hypothetical protein ACFX5Q_06730 [Mesorhizobium sp. IMUNJ 23033]|uniref:hypothetical protein n=1 Tax=Mesorhizobium sp. IMUNJ 23033 TaxID=3378039 RepID=UPI00384B29B0